MSTYVHITEDDVAQIMFGKYDRHHFDKWLAKLMCPVCREHWSGAINKLRPQLEEFFKKEESSF